jgi:hypothetical protein
MTLEQITEKVDAMNLWCRWCGTRLSGRDVTHYDHDDGKKLEGFDKPQWISVHCTGCDYDWSWWKLLNQNARRTYRDERIV